MLAARPLRSPADALPTGHRPVREAGALRQPDWLLELTDQVTRSVFAIERLVERVTAMRQDNSHLRTMTADLRDMLESERSESGRRFVAQSHSTSREKRRAMAAEENADALAGMLCDLERQLSSLRTRDRDRPASAATVTAINAGRLRRLG